LLNGSLSQEIPQKIAGKDTLEDRLITVNTHPSNVDWKRVNELIRLNLVEPHHLTKMIGLSFLEEFIGEIEKNGIFEKITFVKDIPGSRYSFDGWSYIYGTDGLTLRAIEGSTEYNTDITRLIEVIDKGKRHYIICDFVLGRNTEIRMDPKKLDFVKEFAKSRGSEEFTVSYMHIYTINNFQTCAANNKVRLSVSSLMTPLANRNNLAMVFSLTDKKLSELAGSDELVYGERDYAYMHSFMFKDQKKAYDVIKEIYARVSSIDKNLGELWRRIKETADLETPIVRDIPRELEYLFENYEKVYRNTMRHFGIIYSYLNKLDSSDQIYCLEVIRDLMPDPDCNSLETLRRENKGVLVFPRMYTMSLSKLLKKSQAWLLDEGEIFDRMHFEIIHNYLMGIGQTIGGRIKTNTKFERLVYEGNFGNRNY